MIRVAINGLGRIGRAAFKALTNDPEVEIVAVNDLASAQQLAYLLNYDTVYGKLSQRVFNDNWNLYSGGKTTRVLNIAEPVYLPWREMNIDVVLECTGKFLKKEEVEKHLHAGARHVILSAPSESEDMLTIIHGVNSNNQEPVEIVSCASCTTNCIAPVLEVLDRRIGIRKSIMTTIHAYTANQSVMDGVVDGTSGDLRRGRAAAANFIPSTTAASFATSKVLPHLKNKFEGIAIQGPVPVGSLADITIVASRPTSVEEINNIFSEEAGSERYVGILGVNVDPIVSSDIMLDPRASVIDLTLTQVVDGDLIKIMAWYDNEWGYVNQMIKEAKRIVKVRNEFQQAQAQQEYKEIELV